MQFYSVLSYGTMLHRVRILEHVWSQLAAGGRLVITEAEAHAGFAGRLQRPFVVRADEGGPFSET